MQDVARAAGVSLKTVSRVINREDGVAATTASFVAREVERLGNRPNDLARSLRQGRDTGAVGLVIGDVGSPFYSGIAGVRLKAAYVARDNYSSTRRRARMVPTSVS